MRGIGAFEDGKIPRMSILTQDKVRRLQVRGEVLATLDIERNQHKFGVRSKRRGALLLRQKAGGKQSRYADAMNSMRHSGFEPTQTTAKILSQFDLVCAGLDRPDRPGAANKTWLAPRLSKPLQVLGEKWFFIELARRTGNGLRKPPRRMLSARQNQ